MAVSDMMRQTGAEWSWISAIAILMSVLGDHSFSFAPPLIQGFSGRYYRCSIIGDLMKLKNFSLIISLFLAVLFEVGCSDVNQPTLSAPSPTRTVVSTPTAPATPTRVVISGTVSIWHSFEDPYITALLRQIDAFQKIYPDVHFDVTYIPNIDLKTSFIQAASDGYAPSLLLGSGEWGPELFDGKFITGIAGDVSAEALNNLNSAAVDAAKYRGELIGLPITVEGVVLYRNRDIISNSPSTFSDLISLSQDAAQGDIIGAYLDRSYFYSGGHLEGLGGRLMDESGMPTFNNKQGLNWLELLQSFELAGPTDYFTDQDVQQFIDGRVGFVIDSTQRRTELVEGLGADRIVIDPWPLYNDGHLSGFVTADNIYLTPRALDEKHGVSLRFAEYMISPDSQSLFAETGLIPAISGSPVILAGSGLRIDDPLISQAMFSLVEGAAYPVLPQAAMYQNAMDIALQSVFNGFVTPEEALQDAYDDIISALADSETTPTP